MSNVTIQGNHPVRKAISDLPNYFDSKGAASCDIDSILADYDMRLDCFDCPGDEGSTSIPILPNNLAGRLVCDDCNGHADGYNNCISFSWYKLRSNRWEVIIYVT